MTERVNPGKDVRQEALRTGLTTIEATTLSPQDKEVLRSHLLGAYFTGEVTDVVNRWINPAIKTDIPEP